MTNPSRLEEWNGFMGIDPMNHNPRLGIRPVKHAEMGQFMSKPEGLDKWQWWLVGLAAITVLLTPFGVYGLIRCLTAVKCFKDVLPLAGQFGDLYGAANALLNFGGIVLLVWTLRLQQKDSQEARKERAEIAERHVSEIEISVIQSNIDLCKFTIEFTRNTMKDTVDSTDRAKLASTVREFSTRLQRCINELETKTAGLRSTQELGKVITEQS